MFLFRQSLTLSAAAQKKAGSGQSAGKRQHPESSSMYRIAVLLLTGNMAGSLLLFLRNLVVARLVSVEDYGIAATFAISMAVVEMASGLGLQSLIVQDKGGDDPRLQAGLQGFNLLRGLVSAVVLFLLAHPIARFLGIPEIAWAYQLLALVPALRGFEHFDIFRLSRRLRFKPMMLSKVLPALVSVLSIWPLHYFVGGYKVMLYAILIQWGLWLIICHLIAERSYQISFAGDIMRRGLRFGWPVMINNILLFMVFQGDKLIVGREFDMETLAIFAMGFTLTLTPTLVLSASEQQFYLPQLSAAVEDHKGFSNLALAAMQTSLVSGLLLVLGISLLGAPVVYFLLGDKYEALIPLLIWLSILQALRTFKIGGITAALARAQTGNAGIANSFRVLALPFAWHVAASGGELVHIIWIAIAGELCGYIATLFLVVRRLHVNLRRMRLPLLTAGAILIVTAVGALGPPKEQPAWNTLVAAVLFLVALRTMSELRFYILNRTMTKHSVERTE
ncbi:oligosaccharide flippase family protein [Aquicoccus sp. SCR17]|nr:oligosaccharide flippase family protein [Carideicomes alvinocaridis]